jgi:monoterpene epsilon-lactone hydrolase
MASKQSLANKLHYEAMAARTNPGLSPEEMIEMNDVHWTGLTAEPGGVDYIEVDADGVQALWLVPKGCAQDRVLFCAHGGGYVGGSIYTHRKMYGHLAKAIGCRALLFEYAYAHRHKYPVQQNTALAAYRWLLGQDIKPSHIAFIGDSAGGTLVCATLLRARDTELPLPAAAMVISGWLDMDLTGPSYETNRQKDAFFQKEGVNYLVLNILGEHGNRRAPYISPVYADLEGLPPMFLQAGADESLVDDSRMFAERAKKAGVDVRLDVFAEMFHSFQMMAGRAPEADDAIRRFAEWARPKLGLAKAVTANA